MFCPPLPSCLCTAFNGDQCTLQNSEKGVSELSVFTFGLDKTEFTNSKGPSSKGLDKIKITNSKGGFYNGWLVQGGVIRLAMFDSMFEIFKHA